jgi:hypothetical protein
VSFPVLRGSSVATALIVCRLLIKVMFPEALSVLVRYLYLYLYLQQRICINWYTY